MTISLAARRRRRQEDYGMAARIRLNMRAFANYCAIADLRTLQDKGEFFGIDPSHMSRILSGQRAVGAEFIAAVVDAFHQKGMDTADVFAEVFEVYQPDGGDDDKAAA